MASLRSAATESNSAYLTADDAAEIRKRHLKVLSNAIASVIKQVELEIVYLSKKGQEFMFWKAPDSTSFTVQELLDGVALHFKQHGFYVIQTESVLYISWRSATRRASGR